MFDLGLVVSVTCCGFRAMWVLVVLVFGCVCCLDFVRWWLLIVLYIVVLHAYCLCSVFCFICCFALLVFGCLVGICFRVMVFTVV